jgi:phosphoribosyl 1,2-cyclic phosphodiesterase
MSLSICNLGSGSSGNSTVVKTPQGAILIDAGFGPRVTAQRLHGTGVELENIAAICVTHLDSDHFNTNWYQTIVKLGIRVYAHAGKVRKILQSPEARALEMSSRLKGAHKLASLVHAFDESPFTPLPGLSVTPFALVHDETGSHGFLAEAGGFRFGLATDLGRVPDSLLDILPGVHLLALESNYDPDMEMRSSRPWYLKQRIMGGSGHLSNEQAFAAIVSILDRCQQGAMELPRHIVLLHRSRECNCPKLVKRLFTTDPRIKPRLTLTNQYQRTQWLSAISSGPMIGEQLTLALGL